MLFGRSDGNEAYWSQKIAMEIQQKEKKGEAVFKRYERQEAVGVKMTLNMSKIINFANIANTDPLFNKVYQLNFAVSNNKYSIETTSLEKFKILMEKNDIDTISLFLNHRNCFGFDLHISYNIKERRTEILCNRNKQHIMKIIKPYFLLAGLDKIKQKL